MSAAVNINTYLNVLSLVALGVVAFYIARSKVKNENLSDLKERVAILEKERDEARSQHIENQKAIANLEGQLKTYKEIPLKQIAASLSELSLSNVQILSVLQGSALIAANDRDMIGDKRQTVKEMTVEHQTIKGKE